MNAVDTSVALVAFASWRADHEEARAAAADAVIAAHSRLETYSVLTRLPAATRVSPADAMTLLGRWFPEEKTLVPSVELSRSLVGRCADAGVWGGAVYDALVALTAAEAGATLLTRDARASDTYRRLGVSYEPLG